MVHYGLGAVLTAAIRQRIRESLGPFETGNRRWYAWISNQLLRYGTERDTSALLQEFLGRPVSPEVLLNDIRGLSQSTN
jgi:Zn-dependent M32 family carboxypeptidase